ncbi:MAG: serine/threonine-protein kinase [Polyangiales bacterium]
MADDPNAQAGTDETQRPGARDADARDADARDAQGEGAIPGVSAGMLLDGRYRIVKLLGAGGMGTVYEACNERIDRRVAVKFLQPDLVRDRDLVARFLQEARTASLVRHPHIVELIDSGQAGDLVWLVMELLEGESLQSLLDREGPLSPEHARTLLDPVCAALSHVHARGVIHRDIKPDNVFLARVPGADAPSPRLLDFGIARCLSEKALRVTTTGTVLGTPAYMSPEQCMGQRELTAAADQYALGATLFEMLSGKLPHAASNYNELVVKRATEDALRLEVARPGIPPAWCDLVARCLARRPEDRFATIDAMRDAMRAIPHGDAPASPPRDRSPLALASTHVSDRNAAPRPAAPRPAAPRVSAPWLLATAAVLTLGGVLAWRASTPQATTVTPPRALPATVDAHVAVDAALAVADDASAETADASHAATIATADASSPEHHAEHRTHGGHRSTRARIDRAFPGAP